MSEFNIFVNKHGFMSEIPEPMKYTILHKLFIVIVTGSMLSCVPLSKFDEIQKKSNACSDELSRLKAAQEKLLVSSKECISEKERLAAERDKLVADSLKRSGEFHGMENNYNKLEQQYHDLQVAQENLTKGNVRETTKLLSQLQATQDDLQKREDQLKKLEFSLDEKKRNLDALTLELNKRNARMKELESVLHRKDSTVMALKTKVSDALLGFEKEGLTVQVRNGKVYVSLEEKLLFPSGKADVNKAGVNALKKLAKVLEQNLDINITIEGHTDDVPYHTDASIQDNWDLSVKRSTAVVRILLQGTSIDPKRLTASGRGEFVPVDKAKTSAARQKNRRTEIILTPKLDEVLKILESN
jgi:chemotaxis protein MotB